MKRVIVFLLFASCVPDLGERDSLVKETTILAIRGEPPEVAPGARVNFQALIATPEGLVTTPLARWDYCASAKRLTENGSVSADCLRDTGVIPVAPAAATVEASIPANACNIFGPRTLVQEQRPRDPDITGGYYQPIRVAFDGKLGFGFERVSCGAPLAPILVVEDYGRRYRANVNPTLLPIEAPASASPGARVALQASWSAESAEAYAVYDIAEKVLVDHRESMRVSWFATAGAFDTDRTGRSEAEMELFTANGWTAPEAAQPVHFFVVLRDPRGGTAFQTFDVNVR